MKIMLLILVLLSYITGISSNNINFKNIKYKKHTNFAIESINNIDNDNDNDIFGKSFKYSPINNNCKSIFEKNMAIKCLKLYPDNFECIYNYCISPSKPQPYYINITLPKIL